MSITTLRDLLNSATEQLASAGFDTADLDAAVLLEHCLEVDRLALLVSGDKAVTPAQADAYKTLVKRRLTHEPVAYITGEKEFWSHTFKVEPGVLIPRPDSETLLAALLALMPKNAGSGSVAELGVGSGAVLLSVLKELPNLYGHGVDIAETPLKVTANNAHALNVAERLTLYKGSWADPLPEPVSIIISNPPYIAQIEWADLQQDVKEFEPEQALLAGEDGLDAYRELIPSAAEKLVAGGLLLLEIGHTQAEAVKAMLTQPLWSETQLFNDLAGRPRVVAALKSR